MYKLHNVVDHCTKCEKMNTFFSEISSQTQVNGHKFFNVVQSQILIKKIQQPIISDHDTKY